MALLAEPLVQLGILVTVLFAIAMAQQINKMMDSVANALRSIPFHVGDPFAGVVDSISQGIAYVLGKAEAGVDAAIGASWHMLARLADAIWHQLENTALGYLQLAELVARLVYAHSGLRLLVHRYFDTVHGIEHGVKTLERKYHGIEAKVARLEHDITKGIGHDLHIGLRDLRKEVQGIDHTVTTDIPKSIGYADAQTTALGKFIGAIPGVNYLDWVKGLVAAGLAALGLNWINCKEGQSLFNQRGCGMWNDLGNLLGWIVDLFVLTEACDVLPLLESAVSDIALPVVVALTDAGAGLCAADSSAPAVLTGTAIDTPTVYYTGKLITP